MHNIPGGFGPGRISVPVDYGYHGLSVQEKIIDIVQRMKTIRIFADVYQTDEIRLY